MVGRPQLERGNEHHVFLCFHPLCRVYLRGLIDQLGLGPDDYQVFEYYPKPLIEDIDEAQITRYHFANARDELRNLKNYRERLGVLEREHDRLVFYFPHPCQVISNTVFFSENPRFRCCLIPDGLLNYTNTSSRSRLVGMLKQSLLATAAGLPYQVYLSHLSAYESGRYARVFALDRRQLVTTGKRITELRVDLGVQQGGSPVGSVLIGQGLTKFGAGRQQAYAELVRDSIHRLRDEGVPQPLDYKPHPNETVDPEMAAMLRREEVAVVTDQRAVEQLAASYRTVVSFHSSALLNIALLYRQRIRCIALIDPRRIRSLYPVGLAQLEGIRVLMEQCGVEVWGPR